MTVKKDMKSKYFMIHCGGQTMTYDYELIKYAIVVYVCINE